MQIDINSRKQLNKPENYAAFYSLLNRLPTSDRDALKESIVSQYTEGRTTSLRDMTLKEYSAAVAAMQKGTVVDLTPKLAMAAGKLSLRHALPMADAIIRNLG